MLETVSNTLNCYQQGEYTPNEYANVIRSPSWGACFTVRADICELEQVQETVSSETLNMSCVLTVTRKICEVEELPLVSVSGEFVDTGHSDEGGECNGEDDQ